MREVLHDVFDRFEMSSNRVVAKQARCCCSWQVLQECQRHGCSGSGLPFFSLAFVLHQNCPFLVISMHLSGAPLLLHAVPAVMLVEVLLHMDRCALML
jgi:hypothetical protein